MALGVSGTGERGNQKAIEFAVEGGDVDTVLFALRRRVIRGKVEEMLAIGEKERPAMGGMARVIELCDWNRSAAVDRNLVDHVARARCENNDAAGAPRAAAGRGRVT